MKTENTTVQLQKLQKLSFNEASSITNQLTNTTLEDVIQYLQNEKRNGKIPTNLSGNILQFIQLQQLLKISFEEAADIGNPLSDKTLNNYIKYLQNEKNNQLKDFYFFASKHKANKKINWYRSQKNVINGIMDFVVEKKESIWKKLQGDWYCYGSGGLIKEKFTVKNDKVTRIDSKAFEEYTIVDKQHKISLQGFNPLHTEIINQNFFQGLRHMAHILNIRKFDYSVEKFHVQDDMILWDGWFVPANRYSWEKLSTGRRVDIQLLWVRQKNSPAVTLEDIYETLNDTIEINFEQANYVKKALHFRALDFLLDKKRKKIKQHERFKKVYTQHAGLDGKFDVRNLNDMYNERSYIQPFDYCMADIRDVSHTLGMDAAKSDKIRMIEDALIDMMDEILEKYSAKITQDVHEDLE